MAEVEEHQVNVPGISTFEAMKLHASLLQGIYGYGYTVPTPIQQRFMIPFIQGKDVIAQASSGSGKTSAFCLCLLQNCDPTIRETQGLVLNPTRELAIQTQDLCNNIGHHMGISAHACIGGKSLQDDIRRLESGVHLISGTPGRVFDMIRRRSFRPTKLKTLVLDEADEMLSRGFKEQIHKIYRFLPATQMVLVSATLPGEVLELSQKFLTDPVRILVRRDEISVDSIDQYFVAVEHEMHKFETLCDLYETLSVGHSIIFCNSRAKINYLSKKMEKKNFPVCSMHGDMPQVERDAVMQKFREGACRMLISTDLWSRGIDIAQMNLVINYDFPLSREQYIHRIGRTGRLGRKGLSISLVKKEELSLLKDVEQYYAMRIEELPANIGEKF